MDHGGKRAGAGAKPGQSAIRLLLITRFPGADRTSGLGASTFTSEGQRRVAFLLIGERNTDWRKARALGLPTLAGCGAICRQPVNARVERGAATRAFAVRLGPAALHRLAVLCSAGLIATVDWESAPADLFHSHAKAGAATAIITAAAAMRRVIFGLPGLAR